MRLVDSCHKRSWQIRLFGDTISLTRIHRAPCLVCRPVGTSQMSRVELPEEKPHDSEMPRALTLTQAVALNVANMVGIGPFITIPLFLSAMHGPHALVAWG